MPSVLFMNIGREKMTITETANLAINYIMEIKGKDICKELRKDAYENILCSKHCQGLDEFCVKRLLTKKYK